RSAGQAALRRVSATRGNHRASDPRDTGGASALRFQGEVMDLSTTYLGMRLPHPLIVGAGPLGDDLDTVRALEDAGAAMLVLRSLYEEEITFEQMDAFNNEEGVSESFAEAASFAPDPLLALGPDEYLEHLRLGKEAGHVTALGSLNGVTPGGWLGFAKLLEQAGADGIELHLYHAASDMT